MARRSKDNTATQRKKHAELQGRGKGEGNTHIKKGSRMPAAGKKPNLLPFIVAEGIRMGRPNEGLTQADPNEDRIAEYGDTVMLTKSQAEWCMANGFIDSVLPDFADLTSPEGGTDDPDKSDAAAEPVADSAVEEGAGNTAKRKGEPGVGDASEADAVPATPKRASRRKASSL